MTRDTDGTPPRLMVLEGLLARLTALWKKRRGDVEDPEADQPDGTGDSTGTIARKVWIWAAGAAVLLAVTVIWGLFSNLRVGPGGTAQHSVRATAGPAPAKRHPASGEMDRQLPDDYHVLLTRSIFAKDGAPAAKDAVATADNLVLKGVTQEDQRFTAYFGAADRVLELHAGDALAMGTIHRITLHAIEYQAGGRLTRVEIGQAIDAGVTVADPPLASESGTEASRPAPGPPPGPPPSPPTGPAAGARLAPDHPRELPVFAGEPTR